jgi:hypothetical protein
LPSAAAARTTLIMTFEFVYALIFSLLPKLLLLTAYLQSITAIAKQKTGKESEVYADTCSFYAIMHARNPASCTRVFMKYIPTHVQNIPIQQGNYFRINHPSRLI